MYTSLLKKEKKISVIGLGYVGLPIALEFAKHFSVIGFDIEESRILQMKKGIDPSKELETQTFEGKDIIFTSNPEELRNAHFHIITVPTDIDEHKVPDLGPLLEASKTVGNIIKSGDYVVYESTVYPGCTEDDCIPALLEAASKQNNLVEAINSEPRNVKELTTKLNFKFGYSPERIVPGDKTRTLSNILKIVSGNDKEALEEISKVYGHIITAGIHKASSIKVAEAAKVIENTQRDLNISLMNELAIIFDKLGIDTKEVIDAAGTKWNFHKYHPGLVGGHCISVDPYYLIHKSRQLGHDPQVIAAGRRINDEMPKFIAKKLVQKLIEHSKNPGNSRVLVMGISFKENVADVRNSKVLDLIYELHDYSLKVDVVDPFILGSDIDNHNKINLITEPANNYDAIIVAVGHTMYKDLGRSYFEGISNDKVILLDIKGIYSKDIATEYWKL